MNDYDHIDYDVIIYHIDDPQKGGDSFNSKLSKTVIVTNASNDDNDRG